MEIDLDRIISRTDSTICKNSIYMLSFFSWGLLTLFLFIVLAPDLPNVNNSVFLTFPYPLENLEKVSDTIKIYYEEAFFYTLSFFMATYLILQSLAIPGPVCLSFMAGLIFGRWMGLFIVIICYTLGSSFCFLLYKHFGQDLVLSVFPSVIKKLNEKVLANKEKLFQCLFLLRLLPIIPNWMINFSSPIIGIPLSTFVISTFLGLIVPNFIQISAGIALKDLTKQGPDYISIAVIGLLVVFTVGSMFIEKKDKVKV